MEYINIGIIRVDDLYFVVDGAVVIDWNYFGLIIIFIVIIILYCMYELDEVKASF